MNFPEFDTHVVNKAKADEAVLDRKSYTAQRPKTPSTDTTVSAQSVTAASDTPRSSLSVEQARKLADEIVSKLQERNVNVGFKVDEELDTVQIELRDSEGNVVRKIPSDDFLKLSQNIRDGRLSGTLNLNS